jgi:DNA replication and repair protein RecF
MHLNHLSLTNFRNYARLELTMPKGALLLYGDNAQGKTSLLEAVYYLATSKSPYTTSDRELINWLVEDDPMPFARLVAEVNTAGGIKRIEVTIINAQAGRRRRIKKEVRVNGIKRRVMDLLGQLRVVMFLPRDLSLVEGSPRLRRRYLNVTLCQTDLEYCSAVSRYEKALRQRNALLREFQEQGGRGDYARFDFWDDKLAEDGAIIVAGRYRLIRELERRAQTIHRDLSGEGEHLRLRYEPGFDAAEAGSPEGQLTFGAADLGAAALPQLKREKLSERFRSALVQRRKRDARRGSTSIGPQRDEMRFLVNRRDLGMYGSRGQNRTAVLALKLAELDWMREISGEWPILLLDEVAAELDPNRRAYLLDRIYDADQVMLTTTEPNLLTGAFLERAQQWQVEAGSITIQDTGVNPS